MPRTARLIAPNCLYHIISRGNNQQTVFHEPVDFERYLTLFAKYKAKHPFLLYNYALMSNHVHFLIEPLSMEELARAMMKLNLSYTHYFQKKYGGVGHVWQGRYKSILVGKDSYCLSCAAYIELNPVAAAMVVTPEQYQWSSYSTYAFGKENPLLTHNPLYDSLGLTEESRQAHYRELVQTSWEQKKFKEEEMDRSRFFGAPDFITSMERNFGTYNLRSRGRPRKGDVSNFGAQK